MSKLERWLTLVANLSVVAGIIFLAVEMRQNTEAIRGATYQDLAATAAEFSIALGTDDDLAEIVVRWGNDPDSLNEVERLRMHTWLLGTGRSIENAFQQHRVGTLTDDLWLGYLDTWRSVVNSPGFMDYWATYRTRHSTDFQAYVDSTFLR